MKPEPIKIREYGPDDLEACRDLWRALNARHREIYDDPTIGGEDPGLEFDEYLRDPKLFGVWVAESNGHPVGLCGLLRDGDETELEPIVVRADARRRGTGAALVAHALEISRTVGATYFNVRPVSRNVEAIAFFRRQGFDLLTRTELSMQLARGSTFDHELEFHDLRFRY